MRRLKPFVDPVRQDTLSLGQLLQILPEEHVGRDHLWMIARTIATQPGWDGSHKTIMEVVNGLFDKILNKSSRWDAAVGFAEINPVLALEIMNNGGKPGWLQGQQWSTTLDVNARANLARLCWVALDAHRSNDPEVIKFVERKANYINFLEKMSNVYFNELVSTAEPIHQGLGDVEVLVRKIKQHNAASPLINIFQLVDRRIALDGLAQEHIAARAPDAPRAHKM